MKIVRFDFQAEGKLATYEETPGEKKVLVKAPPRKASWLNTNSDPVIDTTGKWESYLNKIKLVGLDDDGNEVAQFANYGSPEIIGNTDGTQGQVMVKFPPLYVKRIHDTNGHLAGYSISGEPADGHVLHPCFWDYDDPSPARGRNAIYIGAYEASNAAGNKLASVSGASPLTSVTMATFRDRAAARSNKSGDEAKEWHAWDFWTQDFIQLLFYAYYGNRDSQIVLNGFTELTVYNAAYIRNTGRSDILTSSANGSIDYDADVLDADIAAAIAASSTAWQTGGRGTAVANRFLFVENLFGNIWKFMDGCTFDGRQDEGGPFDPKAYATPNPKLFTSVDAEVAAAITAGTYVDRGLVQDGPATFSIGAVRDAFIPVNNSLTGVNTGTYFCSTFYSYLTDTSRKYLRSVRAGGALSVGADAGLAARLSIFDLADAGASDGSRLCFKKL